MTRRTKIVATVGPASQSEQIIGELIRAGVDVFRLNFSHGDIEQHESVAQRIRKQATLQGRYVGILADLQGPKIRIRRFEKSPVLLEEGQQFVLDSSMPGDAGTKESVGVAYEGLAEDVNIGDTLLLDDGHLNLTVEAVDGPRIVCRVVVGGELGNPKGINRHGGGLSAPALTDKVRVAIVHAAGAGVAGVHISFFRNQDDIVEARQLLRDACGQGPLVAKVE